jgi:hypothetical protein
MTSQQLIASGERVCTSELVAAYVVQPRRCTLLHGTKPDHAEDAFEVRESRRDWATCADTSS